MSATINNIAKINKQIDVQLSIQANKQTNEQSKTHMLCAQNEQNCKKISFPDKLSYGKLAGGVGVDGWGDLSGSQPQLLGPGQGGISLADSQSNQG